jgi:hypothetical protein
MKEMGELHKRGVEKIKKIPSSLQPLLWSKGVEKLDEDRDKVYIIHQVLSYGDLKDLRQLFRIYNKKEVKEIFLRFPKKVYQPAVFYFVKNFILGLKKERLKKEDYVKTLF